MAYLQKNRTILSHNNFLNRITPSSSGSIAIHHLAGFIIISSVVSVINGAACKKKTTKQNKIKHNKKTRNQKIKKKTVTGFAFLFARSFGTPQSEAGNGRLTNSSLSSPRLPINVVDFLILRRCLRAFVNSLILTHGDF